MATITPPDLTALAGIPSQSSDTINPTPEGFISGDLPAVTTEDLVFAYSQTILARTPVGFDTNGDLVPAVAGSTAGTPASGQATFSGVGTANDTITIGSITYTLKASVTTTANEVKIGATALETIQNLVAAINGGPGAGTVYGSATVPNADVTARVDSSTILGVAANASGVAGNSIASTKSSTAISWGASTLTGGKDGGGVRAIGLTVIAVTTPASGTKKGAPIYRSGCFNPDLINWPASYDTTAEKMKAFHGAPTPTAIILRAPKAATVSLP